MHNSVPKKAYKNRILNILGLQVARYILAKLALYFRKNLTQKNKTISELSLNGIQFFYTSKPQIKNLEIEFNKLKDSLLNKENFNQFNPKRIIINDETTKVERIEFSYEELRKSKLFNNLSKLISNNKAWKVISNDFGTDIKLENDQIIWFDKITFGQNSDVSNWHTDTFFDNYKYWFFPDGISALNGIPMNYLRRSQRFSFKRIIFEYFSSIQVTASTDLSWRLNKKFFNFFSLKSINNECPPFTGFVANTHGFHSRAKVAAGSIRYQLHMSIRPNNPFSFL